MGGDADEAGGYVCCRGSELNEGSKGTWAALAGGAVIIVRLVHGGGGSVGVIVVLVLVQLSSLSC